MAVSSLPDMSVCAQVDLQLVDSLQLAIAAAACHIGSGFFASDSLVSMTNGDGADAGRLLAHQLGAHRLQISFPSIVVCLMTSSRSSTWQLPRGCGPGPRTPAWHTSPADFIPFLCCLIHDFV